MLRVIVSCSWLSGCVEGEVRCCLCSDKGSAWQPPLRDEVPLSDSINLFSGAVLLGRSGTARLLDSAIILDERDLSWLNNTLSDERNRNPLITNTWQSIPERIRALLGRNKLHGSRPSFYSVLEALCLTSAKHNYTYPPQRLRGREELGLGV